MNSAAAATRTECAADPARGLASGRGTEILDLALLRRFTAGNRALELEVLHLFAAHGPLTLNALRNAATEKAWREAAHTLKGSAGAVGAVTVARLAAEAERLKDAPHAWPSMVERLARAIGEVVVLIGEMPAAA